jgi:hypothetical protein
MKTRDEYKDFEETLLRHFKRDLPITRNDLEFKMTEKGYRRKRVTFKDGRSYIDDRYPVHKNQLDYAYNFLSGITQKQDTLDIRFSFIRESYGYRANRNIEYNNKHYRKGQFLPRSINETK